MGGAIVAGVWGAEFAATAGGILVASAINLGIGAAISFGIGTLMRKDIDTGLESGSHLRATRTTDFFLPLIYGTSRVAPNWVYVGTSGGDNKYLHMIGVLCEGPVEGVHQIGGVDQLFINDKIYTEYGGGRIYYEFFRGTATQNACATLTAADPSWTDPLRYTCYIYIRLYYDPEYFNSIPNVTVTIDGLHLYDPTDKTLTFSTNPALCIYDMLTRPSTRGGMGLDSWHGYGSEATLVISDGIQKNVSNQIKIDDGSGDLLIYDGIQQNVSSNIILKYETSQIIDVESVDTAKDYCTAKGWECNIIINEDRQVMDNIGDIRATFRGELIPSAGKIKLLFRDLNYESSVMALDEDDIVQDSIEISESADLFDRPNAIEINYLSEDGSDSGENRYQTKTFVFSDADAISNDGDFRSHKINLMGISSLDSLQKMASYLLERMRNGKNVRLIASGKAATLEPMDLISLSYDDFGWTSEDFRVIDVSYNSDGTVGLSLIEEDISLYDDNYTTSNAQWYTTTLPDATASPPNVTDTSLTEEVYYYRGRSFTRLKVNFSKPAEEVYPWWDHAEIWVAFAADSDYKFMTVVTDNYVIDPVEEGEEYWIKIRGVSTMGRKESLSACVKLRRTITGKSTAPGSLVSISAITSNMNVKIYGEALPDPDIDGYELRIGDSWPGGVFIGLYNTPYAQILSMRPGSHTFWMAAKGNNGVYSTAPVSASVNVVLPPGYSSSTSWAWNYNGIGTHDNTEYTTYNSTDALICSHTTGDLSGTWHSPIYDLTNSTSYLIYGDFRTIQVSTSKTFASVFQFVNDFTFGQVLSGKNQFSDLWSTQAAGQLNSTISWGAATDALTNSAGYFELSALEINGRYLKVDVTITDPDLNSNLYLYTLNLNASTWS